MGNNHTKLGEYITQLRKQKNLTQKQLGKLLGLDYSSISKYESGKRPPLEILEKMSSIFNISLNDLLGQSISTEKREPIDIPKPGDIEELKSQWVECHKKLKEGIRDESRIQEYIFLSEFLYKKVIQVQAKLDQMLIDGL